MSALLKLMTGTLCSRILGFLRDIVFFAVLGSSREASAFLIAFALPNLFRRLCGEGALSAAFIPVFAQRYAQQPQTTNDFLSKFFTHFGMYLGLAVGIGMIALGIGQTVMPSPKWRTVLFLTLWMLPYLWFICTAALLNGALNVLNKFSLTAFSPVLLNLSFLIGLALCPLCKTPHMQVSLLSVCVVIGGFLQYFLPKLQLRRNGFRLKFRWGSDADVTRVGQLFLPGVFGAAVFQLNALLGRFFAYTVDDGGASFLYLANRFLELPLGLFSFSIFSVVFPQLSLLIAKDDARSAKILLQNGIRLLLLLLIPAAIGLLMLAEPILDLCFRWGKFSQTDIRQVVPLLKIFALGLPLFGLTALFARIFYAHKDTQTPVKISVYTLVVYVLCAVLLMKPFGVSGLALASVVSNALQWLLQIYFLQQKYSDLRGTLRIFRKLPWLGFVLFAISLYFTSNALPWSLGKTRDALLLSALITAAVAFYLILLKVFDKTSFRQLTRFRLDAEAEQ